MALRDAHTRSDGCNYSTRSCSAACTADPLYIPAQLCRGIAVRRRVAPRPPGAPSAAAPRAEPRARCRGPAARRVLGQHRPPRHGLQPAGRCGGDDIAFLLHAEEGPAVRATARGAHVGPPQAGGRARRAEVARRALDAPRKAAQPAAGRGRAGGGCLPARPMATPDGRTTLKPRTFSVTLPFSLGPSSSSRAENPITGVSSNTPGASGA